MNRQRALDTYRSLRHQFGLVAARKRDTDVEFATLEARFLEAQRKLQSEGVSDDAD